MVDAFRKQYVDLGPTASAGTTGRTGEALFQAYVLPFEVVSVLLLAALIGSIVLSRQDDEGVR
jgi:NADH:ubiquinone oxidoreductase subunit 6 (subunit J)